MELKKVKEEGGDVYWRKKGKRSLIMCWRIGQRGKE